MRDRNEDIFILSNISLFFWRTWQTLERLKKPCDYLEPLE